jgi:hypothetical protein
MFLFVTSVAGSGSIRELQMKEFIGLPALASIIPTRASAADMPVLRPVYGAPLPPRPLIFNSTGFRDSNPIDFPRACAVSENQKAH